MRSRPGAFNAERRRSNAVIMRVDVRAAADRSGTGAKGRCESDEQYQQRRCDDIERCQRSLLLLQGRTEVGTIVAFIFGLTQMNDPWRGLVNYFRAT